VVGAAARAIVVLTLLGVSSPDNRRMSGTSWYEELRERYRPDRLRVLLIGESPPDPGGGARRFFYAPTLAKEDNLYRGVAKALYEGERIDIRDKPSVLARLRDEGYWLIDAVNEPVNKKTRSERRRLIRAQLDNLIATVVELAPESGVIICHQLVYEAASDPLRDAGVRMLHDQALPFPLGNWRERFAVGVRRALDRSALT
jgi:hypothetical protein